MSRRVELRPAAERDLDRLVAFVAQDNLKAAKRRSRRLREALRSLAIAPLKGRISDTADERELVIRQGKASYVARYRVTDDAAIITRIWHGLENRPR
jgi:toxin ParE1/3/4